jgi:protein gp37
MGKTKIEWTTDTWNPIRARNLKTGKTGWHCEHATTGCINCYSERLNLRLGTGLPFKPGHRKDIEIFLDENMLTAPLRWKKPRMIFVCSMTDLFADFVKDGWIDRIFAVMALCPQHTFQVLTKRAERLRTWFSTTSANDERVTDVVANAYEIGGLERPNGEMWATDAKVCSISTRWPLSNCWLGISCERQEEADERIPKLLATPAAVRFISAEPLLGPIDIGEYLVGHEDHDVDLSRAPGSMVGGCVGWTPSIDWVIVGGESGPHARPMHPDWTRSIRDRCRAAGVPFFLKQWGEWAPSDRGELIGVDPEIAEHDCAFDATAAERMARVGKKAAGRMLDGREWNDMP